MMSVVERRQRGRGLAGSPTRSARQSGSAVCTARRGRNRKREAEVRSLNIRTRSLVTIALALVIAFALAAPAAADTIAEKKAQAERVESQIEALSDKAEVATEKYNAARSRYDELSSQVRKSNAKIKKIKARTKVLQTHLDTRANDMYRQGPLGFMSVFFNVDDFEELDYTVRVLTNLNQSDASTVAELKQNRAEEAATNAKLVEARAGAEKQKKAMSANEKAVKSRLAERSRVLDSLNSDVRALLAQKKAAEETAAHERYLALQRRQRSSDSDDSGGDAPTSSKGAAAVYWAMKAIGKPYRWGGSGPDSFDCSGLTSWAYRKVGISLPHSSSAQISQGPRISKSNLEPGDLVFFGSPIHHVGMYVGDGDFIEAPSSGYRVRVVSLSRRSDYAGACRPR